MSPKGEGKGSPLLLALLLLMVEGVVEQGRDRYG